MFPSCRCSLLLLSPSADSYLQGHPSSLFPRLCPPAPASWNPRRPRPLIVLLPPGARSPSEHRRNGGVLAEWWLNGDSSVPTAQVSLGQPLPSMSLAALTRSTLGRPSSHSVVQGCRCLLSSSNREFAYVLPGILLLLGVFPEEKEKLPSLFCSKSLKQERGSLFLPELPLIVLAQCLWTSLLWGLLSAAHPFPFFLSFNSFHCDR